VISIDVNSLSKPCGFEMQSLSFQDVPRIFRQGALAANFARFGRNATPPRWSGLQMGGPMPRVFAICSREFFTILYFQQHLRMNRRFCSTGTKNVGLANQGTAAPRPPGPFAGQVEHPYYPPSLDTAGLAMDWRPHEPICGARSAPLPPDHRPCVA
jgi:hypothetical protein